MNKSVAFIFIAIIFLGAAYRMVPYTVRPEWLGAPQLAIAIFAGAVIKNKKWAFALPLFSMLFSDLLMQGMHLMNPAYFPGFYEGQFLNYLLIVGITVIGFFINARQGAQVLAASIGAPVLFFLSSNFLVWIGGGGLGHAKTLAGLMLTYSDGLPFLRNSLVGTIIFSVVIFGTYALASRSSSKTSLA